MKGNDRSKQAQRRNKDVTTAAPSPPSASLPPAAPNLCGIDFTMADFDKLAAVDIELCDADVFLRLLVDEVGLRLSPKTFALVRVTHERLGLALKLLESAQAEWMKRLKSTRSGHPRGSE